MKQISLLLLATATTLATSQGVTTFTEDFNTGSEGWRENDGTTPATWVASGGPDGVGDGYISTSFSLDNVGGFGSIFFRGHGNYTPTPSDGSFVGDWINDSVTEFTFSIRHDAPVELDFFARLATPNNFPAAIANFDPVQPNVWTDLTISIVDIEGEGGPPSSALGNIGNVQITLSAPTGFDMDTTAYTFDVDKIGVVAVPEPSSMLVVAIGGAFLILRRRR